MKILLQAIKSLLRGIEARLTKLLTDNIDSEINSHLAGKLNKNNPVATGSFSLGRNGDYGIGYNSYAVGNSCWATGSCSHAEGYFSSATGENSHAEGYSSASGKNSHAEGGGSASGDCSHAEGYSTIASGDYQHVQGKSNVEDGAGTYAHIVGNGINEYKRSNAHTLDWDGNAWYQGRIKVGGTGWDDEAAVYVLTDPIINTALPASGTALTTNTIYNVADVVGTYVFTAPESGWAHGEFTTDSNASVSFVGRFLGKAPNIEASKTYEFDVLNGSWVVQEVITA